MFLRKRLAETQYHHSCPRCGYYFTENLSFCPLCEKDGVVISLEKAKIINGKQIQNILKGTLTFLLISSIFMLLIFSII